MTKKTYAYIWLSFSIVRAILLFFSLSPQPVLAACVDTDISLQAAAYSRTQSTPIQNHHLQSETTENCFNNSTATSNVQFDFTGTQVIQNRDRNIYQDTPNNPLQGTGIDTPNVETHIYQPLNILLPLDLISH